MKAICIYEGIYDFNKEDCNNFWCNLGTK